MKRGKGGSRQEQRGSSVELSKAAPYIQEEAIARFIVKSRHVFQEALETAKGTARNTGLNAVKTSASSALQKSLTAGLSSNYDNFAFDSQLPELPDSQDISLLQTYTNSVHSLADRLEGL